MLNIPLISNNVKKEDTEALIEFLKDSDRFTQGPKVIEFENKWSEWLGVKHSLFVNSGSSANFITLAAIREMYGEGEVIVGPIGWSSDVSAIIAAGLTPVFVDVKMSNLAIDEEKVIEKINDKTRAVLLIHVLGFNALSNRLLNVLKEKNIPLLEDVCESHGATFKGQKVGSFGFASNFSFYYAHHMSTIEGGMICTNDDEFYRYIRMFRSHGMLRECGDETYKNEVSTAHPEVHPEFTFMVPGYNMRSTELNAVIGLNQIKRLDDNIRARQENYKLFMEHLNPDIFYTEFDMEGSSNYAFILILKEKNDELFQKVVDTLRAENVEFRRGTAGGGNLARQPFVRQRFPEIDPAELTNAEHIHQYGIYTGNCPDLEKDKILKLCEILNNVK